jgi:hypothetical protein
MKISVKCAVPRAGGRRQRLIKDSARG